MNVLSHGGSFVVRAEAGASGAAALAHLARECPPAVSVPSPLTSLVNFGEALNLPLSFGGVLMVSGVATLLHLLVSSVPSGVRKSAC